MGFADRLRSCLAYSNVMATIAVFLAMGGVTYAVSVPRNSVGTSQLRQKAVTAQKVKNGSVSSTKVKNFSLRAQDFRHGELPTLTAVRADDTDPAAQPARTLKTGRITTSRPGRIWVFGTLRETFLTCTATGQCSSTWGIYLDGRPVPNSGVRLETVAGESDGYAFYALYGISTKVPAGRHVVTLGRADSPHIASVGQLGAQLGALASGE
jgi:hypothetical protein